LAHEGRSGSEFLIDAPQVLWNLVGMMKAHSLIFIATLVFSAGLGFAQAPANADTFYRQGVAAEQAGDADAARAAYEQALRLNPNHADATFRIGQLRLRRDTIARQGRVAAFNGVMLREIRLDDASLRESLDALGTIVESQSESKVTPNFVIQDADGKLADAKITLNLRNVTSGAVLEYMLGMANARARHDEFAIVILPN